MSDTHHERSTEPTTTNMRPALDDALERLAVEIAAARAERDEVAERERFASAVRELRDIAAQRNVPIDLPTQPVEAAERRRHWFRRALAAVGIAVASFIVLGVLLVSVGPKVAPYHTYFVRSGSMEPTFQTGDLIVLKKVDASDIKKGDIITFERPDKRDMLVTHRVIAVDTTGNTTQFQTKGDANASADPWRVPASGTQWKYKLRVSKLGYVFDVLSKPLARLALAVVPLVLLGALWVSEMRKRRS